LLDYGGGDTVASAATIIRDVRVFDGHRFIEKATVVLDNDQIKRVSADLSGKRESWIPTAIA
jgi:N-acetylglucosamine-6-phosphate deacetylase